MKGAGQREGEDGAGQAGGRRRDTGVRAREERPNGHGEGKGKEEWEGKAKGSDLYSSINVEAACSRHWLNRLQVREVRDDWYLKRGTISTLS
jgi:hypothetical protein